MNQPENTNCLRGFKCPKCKATYEFRIEAKTMATVTDDGVSDYENMEWDKKSYCECVECGFYGQTSDFQKGTK